MHTFTLLMLLRSLALAADGDQGSPPSSQAAAAHPADSVAAAARDAATSETAPDDARTPADFIPSGSKQVDTVMGDLTGRGLTEMALVFEAGPVIEQAVSDSRARTVRLLIRDASGQLQRAADNDRIVPCARCGGLAGDPYGFVRIETGMLTVAVYGGSRERWFADYQFRYLSQDAGWQLTRVERGVTDTMTDVQKREVLTASDFGAIGFADFYPASLPPSPVLD